MQYLAKFARARRDRPGSVGLDEELCVDEVFWLLLLSHKLRNLFGREVAVEMTNRLQFLIDPPYSLPQLVYYCVLVRCPVV